MALYKLSIVKIGEYVNREDFNTEKFIYINPFHIVYLSDLHIFNSYAPDLYYAILKMIDEEIIILSETAFEQLRNYLIDHL